MKEIILSWKISKCTFIYTSLNIEKKTAGLQALNQKFFKDAKLSINGKEKLIKI